MKKQTKDFIAGLLVFVSLVILLTIMLGMRMTMAKMEEEHLAISDNYERQLIEATEKIDTLEKEVLIHETLVELLDEGYALGEVTITESYSNIITEKMSEIGQ